ncbi:unnamed protein product, partial [Mesorhabditis belari]|uniref:C-type lectin domain-containing protein n=1 Tax=Mesorhabditis belari TaxID=2138241 RepID=A0AAF3EX39_9BILA
MLATSASDKNNKEETKRLKLELENLKKQEETVRDILKLERQRQDEAMNEKKAALQTYKDQFDATGHVGRMWGAAGIDILNNVAGLFMSSAGNALAGRVAQTSKVAFGAAEATKSGTAAGAEAKSGSKAVDAQKTEGADGDQAGNSEGSDSISNGLSAVTTLAKQDLIKLKHAERNLARANANEKAQHEKSIKKQEELGELIQKMQLHNVEMADYEKVLPIMEEAVRHLTTVRKQWRDMSSYFLSMKEVIVNAIQKKNLPQDIIEDFELSEDKLLEAETAETLLRLVGYCIQVENAANLYIKVSTNYIFPVLGRLGSRFTLKINEVKDEQKQFEAQYNKTMDGVRDFVNVEKKNLESRFQEQMATYTKSLSGFIIWHRNSSFQELLFEGSAKMFWASLLIPLGHIALAHQLQHSNPLSQKAYETLEGIHRNYISQKSDFDQAEVSYNKLVSDAHGMVISDEIFNNINNLISRLSSEKNELEGFLEKVGNQRLTILNKKEEQTREKKRLENEVSQMRMRLKTLDINYENERRYYHQVINECNQEVERRNEMISQRDTGTGMMIGGIIFPPLLIAGAVKHGMAQSKLNVLEPRLGQLYSALENSRLKFNSYVNEINAKAHAVAQLEETTEYLSDEVIPAITMVFTLTNAMHVQLNAWITDLSESKARAIRLRSNIDFDDDTLTRKSLSALRNRLMMNSCGQKWRHFDGYCYHISENVLNWDEANDWCKGMNANLVSIHNERENRFVSSLIPWTGRDAWIGLTVCM